MLETRRTVTIHLEPWEYQHVNTVGIGRFVANWGRGNAAHYQSHRMEDDRTAQVAAAACELAVAKHTNQYWHAHVWNVNDHAQYRDLPDVGRNIEVRRIRTRNPALRLHQLRKGLTLWVARVNDAEIRSIELLGWIDYDEGFDLGVVADYDDRTRLLDLNYLKAA